MKKNTLPIVIMILLFGMIGFITGIAAPAGTIWMKQYEGSAFVGMLGNLMNFLAYLVMGIPSGLILRRIGYRKTALIAVIVGLIGICVQFLSGKFSGDLGFAVYMTGAFVAGFSLCMLNTVVNPMLNTLGGGGKKGAMFLQFGGTLNSILNTVAPVFVGALIGQVTKNTGFADINLVLYIAMGIFALAAIVLAAIKLPEPKEEDVVLEIPTKKSAWHYRHFVLGAIAIFVYVGIEVGVPGTMKFYLENLKTNALLPGAAGTVAATYWFLMLMGRIAGAGLSVKWGSRTLLSFVASLAILLVGLGMLLPDTITVSMPVFSHFRFALQTVPISALFFVLVGLCTSVMWGAIFNLAVEGLGKHIRQASGIFMMMVVGGGILPLLQNGIVDLSHNYMLSYIVPIIGLAYILFYALIGSRMRK
ncbi:MFS transporter [Bacteroidia bacterium]|nr:MFS transporter [Bacteroidia bacterium]